MIFGRSVRLGKTFPFSCMSGFGWREERTIQEGRDILEQGLLMGFFFLKMTDDVLGGGWWGFCCLYNWNQLEGLRERGKRRERDIYLMFLGNFKFLSSGLLVVHQGEKRGCWKRWVSEEEETVTWCTMAHTDYVRYREERIGARDWILSLLSHYTISIYLTGVGEEMNEEMVIMSWSGFFLIYFWDETREEGRKERRWREAGCQAEFTSLVIHPVYLRWSWGIRLSIPLSSFFSSYLLFRLTREKRRRGLIWVRERESWVERS